MTRRINQVISTLACMSIFAGIVHADVFFSPDLEGGISISTIAAGSDLSSHRANHDDDDRDDHPKDHKLFADQLHNVSVTLDSAPQLYNLEMVAKPHVKNRPGHHGGEHNSNLFSFDIGVSVNGEFTGVITFDSIKKHWTNGSLNIGQLAGDTFITLDWLNPPANFNKHDFLKIKPLLLTATPSIPTPGTAILMLASFGLSAPRRSRR